MKTTTIILCGGQGTRMKSVLPKVMHEIASLPMVGLVLETLKKINTLQNIVVTGSYMPVLQKFITNKAESCIQPVALGTGDAVKSALPLLKNTEGTVLVLYGDTPLIQAETLTKILIQAQKSDVVVLGFRAQDPMQYGRLITDNGANLTKIVEYLDANEQERNIDLCNSGVMAISAKHIHTLINALTPNNAKGEYYLTDIIEHAKQLRLTCSVIEADEEELMGVNSRTDLAVAEQIIQSRLRQKSMENGVTLIDPSSVYFAYDTHIEPDCVIEPNVYFGPNVTIKSGCRIKAFSHIEGAVIEKNASVGPYARIRPGTHLGEDVKIGNFVEIKKSHFANGAKASHLSYIGDAFVGMDANIGAGTITCNYDGFAKHTTNIGDNVFIGSNTALVAPVTIGDGAVVGAGSVITKDVEKNAIAFERSIQKSINDGAISYRLKRQKEKK